MISDLVKQVKQAASEQTPLHIVGGGSKAFYGRDLSGITCLNTSGLTELVSYDPAELVVQVQAGYPVKDLVDLLANENQMLGFDPTDFGGSTIGGVIASGLSGSRRPFLGAGRDFVLGTKMIDGLGNELEFGGQVMKNVAGYDVSRLLTGSLGCLGVITEVSLKVLPKPEREATVVRPLDRAEVLSAMRKLNVLPETSGLAFYEGQLFARFSGSGSSVEARCSDFLNGADGQEGDNNFWQKLDALALFSSTPELWRVSTKTNASQDGLNAAEVIDWGGGQRWLTTQPDDIETGYVTKVKSTVADEDRFAPLSTYVLQVHKHLKQKFDPHGILNPGKMYRDL